MAVLKDLIVHGRSHFINGAQFNTINAESIGADAGIFNKLIATTLDATTATIDDLTAKNATVTALLDVQGDMHTNSWSNSNIATIDGSFYITPTSVSSDGSDIDASSYTPTGTITYASSNFTKISITGTFDTSQLTLNDNAHIAWPANSEVIVTGDVLVGTEWLPLGTIRGKLESQVAATNASKTISVIPLSTTLTDGQGHMPVTLETIRTGINLSSGTSATLKMRKVKVSLTSRASGSTQYPVGILLSAQGTGTGQTFIDIYGGNNARNGQSGTINGSTKTFTKPMVRLGNLEGLPSLAGQTPSGWGIYTSNGFFEGAIVAKEGYIGNTGSYWTIGGGTSSGATYMYSGPSTISATTTEGTYLGTNGFLNVSAASVTNRPYAQITGGVLTAQGAVIQGALTASSLSTGGRTSSTSAAGTYIDSTGAIYGGSNKFTVTSDGVLTATAAVLKGVILQDANGTTQLGSFNAASGNATIKLGQEAANKFNILITDTAINNKGPGILLRQNTNVLNEITADGMKLYLSGDSTHSIAEFGSTTRIGRINQNNIYITEGSFYLQKQGVPNLQIIPSEETGVVNTNFLNIEEVGASRRVNMLYEVKTLTYEISTAELIAGFIFNVSVKWSGRKRTNANDLVTYDHQSNTFSFTLGTAKTISNTQNTFSIQYDGDATFIFKSKTNSYYAPELSDYICISKFHLIKIFGTITTNASIVTIGITELSHLLMDYHSLQMIDKEGNSYFEAKDLRDMTGQATVVEVFQITGQQNNINLPDIDKQYPLKGDLLNASDVLSVKAGDTSISNYTPITGSPGYIKFTSSNGLSVNQHITVNYKTSGTTLKSFTLGKRDSDLSSFPGPFSTAIGWYIKADGFASLATGSGTIASGNYSHTEGNGSIASGDSAHAEGVVTFSGGYGSHAEGNYSEARKIASHAEGGHCIANENAAHAEGEDTQANGVGSHAEGGGSIAAGYYSHAEGGGQGENYTIAQGNASHAEGRDAISAGQASHAQNVGTRAKKDGQTAIGFYNVIDNSTGSSVDGNGYTYDRGTYAFIIGNGDDTTRSNAFTVDWNGNVTMALSNSEALYTAINNLGWTSSVMV